MSYLYSLFLSLHVINKLGLYMNSHYWGKTLIKLLHRTNSVEYFNSNDSKIEKMRQNYFAFGMLLVITWSRKPCEARDSRHVRTWACEFTSHVDTWVHKQARHVDGAQWTQFRRLSILYNFQSLEYIKKQQFSCNWSNYKLNKWIKLFTYWDNKVITCINMELWY